MKSSILAIIDGSSNNEAVCRWACSLAKATQSDIKVQSIIDPVLFIHIVDICKRPKYGALGR